MAKEYIASKHPGGNRVHIWDDSPSFNEYPYDRELVEKDFTPVEYPSHNRSVEEIDASIDSLLAKLDAESARYDALIADTKALLAELEAM